MQALYLGQAASQVGATYSEYTSSKIADRQQRTKAGIDSRFLDIAAVDAQLKGGEKANKIASETKRVRGQQRAGFAGQGVQVDSGSPASVGAETDLYGAVDEETAKTNGWKEAWGLRSEAENIRQESQAKTQASKRERRATLATGGLKVAESLTKGSYYGKRGLKVPRRTSDYSTEETG